MSPLRVVCNRCGEAFDSEHKCAKNEEARAAKLRDLANWFDFESVPDLVDSLLTDWVERTWTLEMARKP